MFFFGGEGGEEGHGRGVVWGEVQSDRHYDSMKFMFKEKVSIDIL